MPRNGAGVATPVPGTENVAPDTTIESAKQNTLVADIYNLFNTIWPVSLGGTGSIDGSFVDNVWRLKNLADATKRLTFDLSLITTATTRTLKIPDASGTVALTNDPWSMQPIGVPIGIADTSVGSTLPPTDKSYRYIKLTASDAYNTGVLTSESVSGSAPLVQATAVISLAGSPLDGRTVRLINTEGRFLRAGTAAGSVQADALQNMTGSVGRSAGASQGLTVDGGSGVFASGPSRTSGVQSAAGGASDISFDASRVARTDTETRPKNLGVVYYMRVL